MKIKSHVTFPYDEERAEILKKHSIDCKVWEQPLTGDAYITFDSTGIDLRGIIPEDAVVIDSPVYTKSEIENAEWLTCRCTSGKVELINEEETFACEETFEDGRFARHRRLSGSPFYVNKAPKHGEIQGFFYSYSASQYHLFCTERARAALLDPSLDVHASFDPVLLKNGTPAGDLYYLNIGSTLPDGAVLLDGLDTFTCPECGRTTFEAPMQLKLCKGSFLPAGDIAKTPDIFSSGGNLAYPVVIVSQRLRRRLAELRLTRGLVFEPVRIETEI